MLHPDLNDELYRAERERNAIEFRHARLAGVDLQNRVRQCNSRAAETSFCTGRPLPNQLFMLRHGRMSDLVHGTPTGHLGSTQR